MTHKLFIGTIIAAATALALTYDTTQSAQSACSQGIICPAPEVLTRPLSG
ncbi:hypothetical protein [Lentibacter sp. XHP0401]|nr:hypothetical protein [Lentibacter sp. XHP0401]MCV2893608.1 hypothetical protein [Lentibacter sp. XHP0401]